MEKIKLIPLDSAWKEQGHLAEQIDDIWPESYESAEKLFAKILAARGERIEFSRRSKWYVDDRGTMVWLLCDRKSGLPAWKLERMERPPCREKPLLVGKVRDGEQTEKYTYFVCYKLVGLENRVVVLDRPIKEIADIREIEYALVPKDVALRPTILNIVMLDGPSQK